MVDMFQKELNRIKESTCTEEEEIDSLLGNVLKYILQNKWYFLLDISSECEEDKKNKYRNGDITISTSPSEYKGFYIIKSISIFALLQYDMISSNEEITSEEKISFIEKMLPLMPIFI